MTDKKKKYFKNDGSGISVPHQSYLLKWHDAKKDAINFEGPFSSEKDANDILRTYLKNGVCCWVVFYNGK